MIGPSDEYALWCEMNVCPICKGVGEEYDEWIGLLTCEHCGGTGIDPDAEYDGPVAI